MIKAIFFDAVGTLFYSHEDRWRPLRLRRSRSRIRSRRARTRSRVSHSVEKDAATRRDRRARVRTTTKVGGVSLSILSSTKSRLRWANSIGTIFSKSLTNILPKQVFGSFTRKFPVCLEKLQPRFQLAVVSNFDGRLRFILEHLGISKYFVHVFVSSELGADKPDPEIYRRALTLMKLQPNEVLHVGDDPERDWEAATAAGLSIFRLDRPKNSLRDLATILKL